MRFPDAVVDITKPLQLAEKSASSTCIGAALYRANRFEDSIKKLEDVVKVQRPGAANWLFLAMAHQRLGHAEEAKKCLNKADERIDKAAREEATNGTGGTQIDWYGRLQERQELKLIRAEAEALIKDEKKK